MFQTVKNILLKFMKSGLVSKITAALNLSGIKGWLVKIGIKILLGFAEKAIVYVARKGEEKETKKVVEKAQKAIDETREKSDKEFADAVSKMP